jgi:hypothetical protein
MKLNTNLTTTIATTIPKIAKMIGPTVLKTALIWFTKSVVVTPSKDIMPPPIKKFFVYFKLFLFDIVKVIKIYLLILFNATNTVANIIQPITNSIN